MRYLHSMIRVSNLDSALDFFCAKLRLREMHRIVNDKGRYTLVFLAAPADSERAGREQTPLVEITYNWDPETYAGGRNFGHLAFGVEDIYAMCDSLMKAGVTINRPPRDGRMAFVRSPDGISIELLQDGAARPPQEPWASMPNTGVW
jgi:lactoylglutathione lyase